MKEYIVTYQDFDGQHYNVTVEAKSPEDAVFRAFEMFADCAIVLTCHTRGECMAELV